jgi:CheY-like chemotaxis protein
VSIPKCILIVDDQADIRKALHSLLNSNGFEVCGEAVNGQDAIEKAQALHPDLILLDLSMPVMNGLEAARELTKLMPSVPLIMLTNNLGSLVEEEARKAGIRTVLSKQPYEILRNTTRELLD